MDRGKVMKNTMLTVVPKDGSNTGEVVSISLRKETPRTHPEAPSTLTVFKHILKFSVNLITYA